MDARHIDPIELESAAVIHVLLDEFRDEIDIVKSLVRQDEPGYVKIAVTGFSIGCVLEVGETRQRQLCQNFLLNQDVLPALFFDIIDNLSADIYILQQDELLDEYVFLGVLKEKLTIALGELVA